MPPFFSRWLRPSLLVASGTIVMIFALLGVNAVFGTPLQHVASIPLMPSTNDQPSLQVIHLDLVVGTECPTEMPHIISPTGNPYSWRLIQPSQKNNFFTCLLLLDTEALARIQHCQAQQLYANTLPLSASSAIAAQTQLVRNLPIEKLFTVLLPLVLLGLACAVYLQARSASAQMQQLLDQLTLFELQFARNLAQDKHALQEQQNLLQEASHDIRTRVHAVQLLAFGLQQQIAPLYAPQLMRLSTAISQLQQFVQQFLQFSRLQQGLPTVQRERMQLQDLFQELELQFEDIASEKNIELHVKACDIELHTDGQVLDRILANLLANAIKFARHKVLLSARQRHDAIWIEVRDDGPGIPEEEQAMIFSAFYRSPSATKQPGVGLGLAIVKRLLQSLDYRLELISQPGRGSLMRVIIVPHRETETAKAASEDIPA